MIMLLCNRWDGITSVFHDFYFLSELMHMFDNNTCVLQAGAFEIYRKINFAIMYLEVLFLYSNINTFLSYNLDMLFLTI